MKDILYIGRFPEPYGGSTIKNDILYKELCKYKQLRKFDTSELKKNKISYINLLKLLCNRKYKKSIICISNDSLIKLCKLMNIVRKDMISQTTIFVVGGTFDEIITNEQCKLFYNFKTIYVESKVMKENLILKGFNNVMVIPNLRNRYLKNKINECNFSDTNQILKVAYIGRICEEKGINEILKAMDLLNKDSIEINMDFYGPIDESLKPNFDNYMEKNKNLRYRGVIKVDKDNIYEILENYDVTLYPTKWKNEGIPGSIIESKIAGNAVICSKWKNNCDLVNNLIDGIVLNKNNETEIYKAIKYMVDNREKLNIMKQKSLESSEKYIVDNYINEIIERL